MIGRTLAAAGLVVGVLGLLAPAASAHEGRKLGDLEMEVGFVNEPAYVGQPNSVDLFLIHDGEPVNDLGDTLAVEVSFGDAEPLQLTLEPAFEVGEFGEEGNYHAWFFPTSVGSYTFHFSGTIDGEEVDETFTSGPDTFSDVEGTGEVEYPVDVPTNDELAELIDRESARANEAVDETSAQAEQAAAAASQASDDASSAQTLGTIGIVVGALGLIVAIVAVVLSRRKTA
jgi:hypothetical protein